jgi:hypothetical protein
LIFDEKRSFFNERRRKVPRVTAAPLLTLFPDSLSWLFLRVQMHFSFYCLIGSVHRKFYGRVSFFNDVPVHSLIAPVELQLKKAIWMI